MDESIEPTRRALVRRARKAMQTVDTSELLRQTLLDVDERMRRAVVSGYLSEEELAEQMHQRAAYIRDMDHLTRSAAARIRAIIDQQTT